METIVRLSLDKHTKYIAGYPYGKQVFNDQVREKIDMRSQFVIVFPDYIVLSASSFVQGFFSEIRKNIELKDITGVTSINEIKTHTEKCIVVARQETLLRSILSNLV